MAPQVASTNEGCLSPSPVLMQGLLPRISQKLLAVPVAASTEVHLSVVELFNVQGGAVGPSATKRACGCICMCACVLWLSACSYVRACMLACVCVSYAWACNCPHLFHEFIFSGGHGSPPSPPRWDPELEKVFDLLALSAAPRRVRSVQEEAGLRVREHPVSGPYVENLTKAQVSPPLFCFPFSFHSELGVCR